jgi:PAS domain S-box-containing protein
MLSTTELEELLAVPLTVSPETPLAEALSLMNASDQTAPPPEEGDRFLWQTAKNQERASCLLIVEGGQLVGTFAATELVGVAVRELQLETTAVGEVMTREPVTLNKSQLEDIFTILNLCRREGICHFPAVDEFNRSLGLVTPAFIHEALQPANFLQLTTVAEAMERQTLQVSPAGSVQETVRLMSQRGVSCAVVPETNSATGIFTERELLRCLALGQNLAEVAVGEVAIAPVIVSPQASLWEANQLLLTNRTPCLTVITDGGEIVGTIARQHILKTINPIAMYRTIRLLQGKVSELETEKMHVLERQKIQLESQVQERTRELERQARSDRLLLEISSQMRRSLELEDILETAVSQVREFLGCDRVLIYRFDPDWSGVVVAEDVKEGSKPLIGERIHDPCFAPTWVDAYQNGRLRVVNDIYASDITPCHVELLETLGIRAKIVVPIPMTAEAEDGTRSNYLWGLMNASQTTTAREWQSVEVRLLQKLATQIAIAIQQSNLYQQSRDRVLERQRAESTLTQERNLVSAILNVAGALIVVLDKEGRIIRFNKACEQITGYSFDEVFGRCFWDFLLLPEEAESVKGVWGQLLAGEFPNQYENYWVTKTGSRRLIAWSNTALTDAGGNVEYTVSTGIDISDRRYAETALVRSETAYATLADSAPVGIFRHDLSGNCNYANDLACQLAGLLPYQFLGRGWTQMLHPEDRDRVLAEFGETLQTGAIFRSEYRFLRGDGSCVWVLGQSVPQFDDRGQIAGYVGTLMDITQRKEAELTLQEVNTSLECRVEQRTAELQQSNQELKAEILQRQQIEIALVESQEFLHDLFENLNDVVQSVSLETGKFIYANRAWCETLGYEDSEIYHLSIFEIIAAKHRVGFREILNQFKTGKLNKIERLEIPFITKDGREIILEGNINCRYQDGKPTATRGIFRNITERKQTEERLNKVLQELSYHKQALDRFALVAITDARGIITYVNEKLCEISQYQPEELIGKTHRLVNSGYHPPSFFQEMWGTISGGKIWRGEIKNKRKDGSSYWVDSIIVPFLDEWGQPEQYLAIRIDITERKEAEEKLEQQLAAIEASGDGIAILQDDKYIYLNQAHAKLFGYKNAAELIGKTWREVYAAPEIKRLEKEVFPVLAQQKYWRGEAIARRKNDTNFVEELSLTLTEDGSLICVCQDITEKLKTQEKMRRREAQFRAIFEQAAVGIARVALDGGFLQVNQRLCQMLGYSEEEMLAKTMSEITHPDEWQLDIDSLEKILNGEIETFSQEKRYLHKDSSVFWGKITASVVRGSSKERDYFIAVLEDISDRKKAEEDIRNALAREKELSNLKSRFISMTSHEFRTPLSVISSSAGIMKTFNKKLTDEKRLTHLNTIETYVKHTTRLLDDILLLNRAEAGNIPFNPQRTNAVNYCQNLTQEMQTSTDSHVINFTNHCPPETEAELDIKLLQQILINLLSNAIKYSPDGGEIKFDLSTVENKLIFQVRDSGIGIPEEDQKHLFESFHRATNVETIQGTGLGLVIVKKCVELHKGEINFTSELGRGTTFTVTIPYFL